MIYAYARVSTKKQDLERQIEMLKKEYKDATLYVDKYTGKRLDRPAFKKLLKALKPGDTVVFEAVDRMSRNAEEGAELYASLYEKGVELVFLKNPNINTAVYREQIQNKVKVDIEGKGVLFESVAELVDWVNRLLVNLAKEQVKLAFSKAEEEANKISRRTKEALKIASANGKHIGRTAGKKYITEKEKAARKIILEHSRTFGGTLKDNEVMKLCGVTRNTYYGYKKALIAEQNGDKTALEIISE